MNGFGELTGKLEIEERGTLTSPVYLCGTHAVGTVYDAAVRISGRGPDNVLIPVVGECDDGDLADSRTTTMGDVERATEALGSQVAEGNVGAGTGMVCFEFPGGIGTASRRVGDHHVGVLLLCNFGEREDLDVLGTSLGPAPGPMGKEGSCITVCATDAPFAPHQLRRLALRPLLGLARAGSYASEGSGEIGLAFATGEDAGVADGKLNPLLPGRVGGGARGGAQLSRRRKAGRAPRRDDAGRVPDRAGPRAGRRTRMSDEDALRDEVAGLAQRLIRLDTTNPPGAETPAAELLAGLPARGRCRVRARRPGSGAPQPDRARARKRRAVADADGPHRRRARARRRLVGRSLRGSAEGRHADRPRGMRHEGRARGARGRTRRAAREAASRRRAMSCWWPRPTRSGTFPTSACPGLSASAPMSGATSPSTRAGECCSTWLTAARS